MGIHMVRSWWKHILPPWLLIQIPSGLIIFFTLSDWPITALVLFWLLVPFLDALLLTII